MNGLVTSDTMRIQRAINQAIVIVLMDLGSTHNFLSKSVVECIKLEMNPVAQLSVGVANRQKMKSLGIYPAVEIVMQGHSFVVEFYVIPLNDYDVALGAQWLKYVRLI